MTRIRAAVLALAVAASPVWLALSAAPASAAPATGWLRLAHLSPDTPAVDIYLSSYAGGKPVVLKDVSYGDVGSYMSVPRGTYTATMRLAGSAGASSPVLEGTAQVNAGKAYTVAAVGLRKDLTAKVLGDDLTPPPADKGRVRLIQASTRAEQVDVKAIGGPTLATAAEFGTSTGYATIGAGRWSVRVTPLDGSAKPVTTSVDVPAGRISSVLVLDGSEPDSLTLKTTSDSSGSAVVPKGGVATGYGPVASGGRDEHLAGAGLAGAALLGVLVVAARLRTTRPVPAPVRARRGR
ncbi:uncharacterized protein DUF4397 [Motilibacter peucedani]|uniref:Uncharacterized protein DUF4397 n=1 Tax=Motilibacter peucedani TaxID=598650 RepID=A0A420XLM2_9ACTN|nr:DUF4397 domain-containing protein [Motilibacter peucedani]RKS71309.1 uncharacterized protein DUF4397 [Motilibacter peucedani]